VRADGWTRSDAPWGGETRAVDGLIVQAVGPGEERRWFVKQGRFPTLAEKREHVSQPGVLAMLREVCDEIDALPGEWKVETISTPSTILGDLQGSRRPLSLMGGGHEAHGHVPEDFRPELNMLGRVGRRDLLARAG
jgi:hypothetical protein